MKKTINWIGAAWVLSTTLAMAHANAQDASTQEATARAMAEAVKKADQGISAQDAQAMREAQARLRAAQTNPPGAPGRPGLVNMQEVQKLAGSGSVDPAALVDQFSQRGKPTGGGEDRSYKVVAFVSIGMPEASLLRLGRDIKKVGGVMVVRGMKFGMEPGTWQKSLDALKPLINTGAEVQVNPNLFKEFKVTSVPTILISPQGISEKSCSDEQCKRPILGRVVGDVTLEFALDELRDRKDGVGQLARALGDQLSPMNQ